MELNIRSHKRWVHFSHFKIITFSTWGLLIHMQLFIVTWYLDLFKSVKILTLYWKKINIKEWTSTVISGIKGKLNTYIGGTQWSSSLRHCPTSWKAASLIPNGVSKIFHWHNPSSHTMALGLIQPLTKMSTRNMASAWGWQPYHLHVPNVLKSGSLNPLELHSLSRTVHELFYFFFKYLYNLFNIFFKAIL
jgi:hypothetical protein